MPSLRSRSRAVPAVLTAVLLLFPALLLAQFQTPREDELKMTADPKAPGADAVYLDYEEHDDDMLHSQIVSARIKVLTEKGKELATVSLPYYQSTTRVTDIKARTIHPDGTVIPLEGKPEKLLVAKVGEEKVERTVFNLPSVEVGSILEYRYAIRYDDDHVSSPQWQLQKPYYVHHCRYSFKPFENFIDGKASTRYLVDNDGNRVGHLIWVQVLPDKQQLKPDASGTFRLELNDIEPMPHEEWMPPISSFGLKVLFYYQKSANMESYWTEATDAWSKKVNQFAEPNDELRVIASGLVASGDSQRQKAQKLYAAVQGLDNTDFSRALGETERHTLKMKEIRRAADVWREKRGTGNEIAMLYLALLRASGIKAYGVRAADRSERIFNPSYLDFYAQIDDAMAMAEVDGKSLLLDPGQKQCPFGTVSWKHSHAAAVRQSDAKPGLVSLPELDYKLNRSAITGELALDATGTVSGQLRIQMIGQQALEWRQTAHVNDPQELIHRFDEQLRRELPATVEAHVDHFLGLDETDSVLLAIVNVKGQLATVTAKRMIFSGFLFTGDARIFVHEEKRKTAVDMHFGSLLSEQIDYQLPEGFSVEALPEATKIPWPEHAVYVTKVVAGEPRKLTVTRSLARAFTFAKPDEYGQLREFFQKVASADEAQIVLTRAAATGNK